MARINLLPWREAERKRRQQEFAGMAGAGIAFVLFIGVAVHWFIGQQIETRKARNRLLNEEIKELDEKIKKIESLEKDKERLLSRMNVIQELQHSRPEIVHLFDELVKTIPGGVYLTSVQQAGRTIVVSGKAQSNARVSTFMHNIDASEWIGNPVLLSIEHQNQRNARRTSVGGLNLSTFKLQFQQKATQEPEEESS